MGDLCLDSLWIQKIVDKHICWFGPLKPSEDNWSSNLAISKRKGWWLQEVYIVA